jgi:hypothetical protein
MDIGAKTDEHRTKDLRHINKKNRVSSSLHKEVVSKQLQNNFPTIVAKRVIGANTGDCSDMAQGS